MRTCQSCGRVNPPERDFCDCGEYLRWEPTDFMPAIAVDDAAGGPPAAENPPPSRPPEASPAASAPAPPPADTSPSNSSGTWVTVARQVAARPPTAGEPPARESERAPSPAPATPAPSTPPPPEPGARAAATSGVAQDPAPAPPVQPAAEEAQASTEAPPERELASVTLRLPDRDAERDQTVGLDVEPGQRTRLLSLVRNQSGIVDNYELRVDGLPRAWWSIFPDTAYLVPFGSAGTYEQEVEVHLHPPRSPEAEGRQWDLRVVAHSKTRDADIASAPFTLDIRPYTDTETRVRPERAKGRRRADFTVTVENKANAPVLVALEGSDPDGELEFGFDRPPQEIPAGRTADTSMRVTPPKQIWFGRPLEHRLTVTTLLGAAAAERLAQQPIPADQIAAASSPASARGRLRGRGASAYKPHVHAPGVSVGPGGISIQPPQFRGLPVDAAALPSKEFGLSSLKPGAATPPPPTVPLLPSQAVFRQKPWLPWWLLPLGVALAVAAVMLYMLLPRTVTVPELVGAPSAFAAEEELTEAGLKLNADPQEEPTADARPGSILRQTPAGGEEAEKDSAVTIVVAVGDGNATVPDITGMTLVEAEKALRDGGLSLGQSSPQPPDPAAKIASQIPAADEVLKEGAPVDVFFPDPRDREGGGDPGGGAAGTGPAGGGGAGGENDAGGGGGGGGGGTVVIPAVEERSTAAYAQALADEGLVPETEKAYNAKSRGAVFATEPRAGTEVATGAKVKLLVSAGFPQVAFDDDEDILLVNGATGKPLDPVATSSRTERDPSFSADGLRIAFQSDGRISVSDRANPDEPPTPLTPEGDFYRDLAWAPTADTDVLAMLKVGDDGTSRLCFARVEARRMRPDCAEAPPAQIRLSRKINWSPDGRSLLVFGVTAPANKRFGMVRYRSREAFSADPRDWRTDGYVTDTSNPGIGVIDAAIAPDGETMAMIANSSEEPRFRLFTADSRDFDMADAEPLDVEACKVVWRPDGRDVVVMQADECSGAATGRLIRLPVADPTDQLQVAVRGDNPTFQPLTLAE